MAITLDQKIQIVRDALGDLQQGLDQLLADLEPRQSTQAKITGRR